MKIIDEIGNFFIEKTKYQNMGDSPQRLGAEYPEYLQGADPGLEQVLLPDPETIDYGKVDLRTIVEQRSSVRRYSEKTVRLDELSYLLWMTQGVKHVSAKSNLTIRTVPSAGARHPFETYLSINAVSGLEKGLYHFLAESHSLEIVRLGEEVNQNLTKATLNQQHVANAAVVFIWVAIPYRTSWRYGSRAYRYIHLDAGHVCQNLHLAAESIDCGVCAIGAYEDDLVNELVGIDGKEKFAIYLATVGKKIKEVEE